MKFTSAIVVQTLLLATTVLFLATETANAEGGSIRGVVRQLQNANGADVNCLTINGVVQGGPNCNPVSDPQVDGVEDLDEDEDKDDKDNKNDKNNANAVGANDEEEEDDEDEEDEDEDEDEAVSPPTGGGVTTAAPPSLPDIVGATLSTPSLSTLYRLVASSGLAPTLQGEGPFTVFAPINSAFPGGMDLLQLQVNPALPDILTYHVVPGIIRSTNLTDGVTMAKTVQGAEIKAVVNATAGTVQINDANVVVADVEVSNGIVHLIDKVLMPPSGTESTTVAEDTKPSDPVTTPSPPVDDGTVVDAGDAANTTTIAEEMTPIPPDIDDGDSLVGEMDEFGEFDADEGVDIERCLFC